MRVTACANDAGEGPPSIEDTTELGNEGGLKEEQATTDDHDSAACSSDHMPSTTLQARCTLADLLDDDDGKLMLVVSRRALTRSFKTVGEAESWFERFTGATA